MDAITLLKDDHKTVEALFKRFEKAGERAYVERARSSGPSSRSCPATPPSRSSCSTR